jgi:hypothetical protein
VSDRCAKLGLLTEEDDELSLAREFLDGLKEARADFTTPSRH